MKRKRRIEERGGQFSFGEIGKGVEKDPKAFAVETKKKT